MDPTLTPRWVRPAMVSADSDRELESRAFGAFFSQPSRGVLVVLLSWFYCKRPPV